MSRVSISGLTQVALIWPAVMIAAALLLPGPISPPEASSGAARRAAPPSDRSGSTVYVAGDGSAATARVFWETPDRVQVRMVVEIPPDGPPNGAEAPEPAPDEEY
jgi:hypothetical protein